MYIPFLKQDFLMYNIESKRDRVRGICGKVNNETVREVLMDEIPEEISHKSVVIIIQCSEEDRVRIINSIRNEKYTFLPKEYSLKLDIEFMEIDSKNLGLDFVKSLLLPLNKDGGVLFISDFNNFKDSLTIEEQRHTLLRLSRFPNGTPTGWVPIFFAEESDGDKLFENSALGYIKTNHSLQIINKYENV